MLRHCASYYIIVCRCVTLLVGPEQQHSPLSFRLSPLAAEPMSARICVEAVDAWTAHVFCRLATSPCGMEVIV
jgi:hypothetical protein